MKTYLRLLLFAKPIGPFAVPYIISTLLTVIFGTLNFTMLIPLLETLFNTTKDVSTNLTEPVFSLSLDYFKLLFDFHFNEITIKYGKYGALQFVCAVTVASALMSNLFRYLSARIMEYLKIQTIQNIRSTVFNNVINLHIGFFNSNRKGDIISKVSSDVNVVQYTVTSTLAILLKEPLQLIAYFYILFNISIPLTLFSFLVIPISGFTIAFIVKRLRKQATEVHQRFSIMLSTLDESISGIKIVKAFNASNIVKEKYRVENYELSRLQRDMTARQQLASPTSEFLGIVTVACIILYGGQAILANDSALTASQFIAYIAIFSQVTRPAKAISDAFTQIHQGLAAGERVLNLIDTNIEVKDKDNAQALNTFSSEIEFKNVSFAYNEKTILNNLNFNIKKGETVALVGPSGGGKSTTCDLLPRFYDVKEGAILIDGHDIRNVTQESLRNQFGIVPQESILFNDTIFNNIAFGNPDATFEQVVEAAKIANAHGFITESDNGYNTYIGDRGTKLSGGQRQRLCIARAILKNPPIMLLDEATSALDTESEKLVQEALTNLMKNRTSIVIAHRLSTIQNADKIIVIDNGSVIEEGSHQELIEKEGLYFKLVNMQSFNEKE